MRLDSPYYILDEFKQVRRCDFMQWIQWFTNHDRIVQQDWIGGVFVSTVFLGIEHGLGANNAPLLFETMVFHGKHDGEQKRCSTWAQAIHQHHSMVSLVRPSVSAFELQFSGFMRWRNELGRRMRMRWGLFRARHFGWSTWSGKWSSWMQSFMARLPKWLQ